MSSSEHSIGLDVTLPGIAASSGYTLSPGSTLGQYKIIRPLGKGGMGEVYEAEHQVLRKRYALKLLPQDFASQTGALERFQREAQVMANLDHPNILKVDEFGEVDGRYWLRMELAEGVSVSDSDENAHTVVALDNLVDLAAGKVPQELLLPIFKQILEGLQYAHGRGAVHRDLKPSNILLVPGEGENPFLVKIADFGLVRLVGEDWVFSQAQLSVQRSMSIEDMRTMGGSGRSEQGSSTRALLGTFEYMSPEQKRGEDATAQSDLYSVGLMAFKLLTGQNPGLKLPSRIDPTLSKDWDYLLERAMESSFTDRWPDASTMLEVLADLSQAIDLADETATDAAEAEQLREVRRRRLNTRDSEQYNWYENNLGQNDHLDHKRSIAAMDEQRRIDEINNNKDVKKSLLAKNSGQLSSAVREVMLDAANAQTFSQLLSSAGLLLLPYWRKL